MGQSAGLHLSGGGLPLSEKLEVSPIGDPGQADRRRAASRTPYLLLGGVALVTVAGLIGWHFFDGRGEVLRPDGAPVVTVMDFGRSFPLDPLPSGWQHRKFWTRPPMTARARHPRRTLMKI